MDNKVVVFDFDKTLTYQDTLLGFFICLSGRNMQLPFKLVLYYGCMVLTKFKITNNTYLKKLGISIFLKNKSQEEIINASRLYKKKIKFNKLFEQYDFYNDARIFIVSASFKEYLNNIFPKNIKIIGSQLEYSNGFVKGLKFNCFKEQKVDSLTFEGIVNIDEFYTDSYSDFPLAEISKKIFIVKGDKIFECNNIKEFNTYFGKKNTE